MSIGQNKRALVCGAGGFIGNHLVNQLKEDGLYVVGVDLKYPEYSKSLADEFFISDLRIFDNVDNILKEGFDEVYQLAADMGGIEYISGTNDADIMTNSVLINLNILKSAVSHNIQSVLYSSSACVYAEEKQQDIASIDCRESSSYPANPDTEYGWEKLFSERLYLAYNKNYGMKNKIVRYHNIFGPYGTWDGGKEKAPAALCRKVLLSNGEIDIFGDGNQVRTFLYVDECIKATVKIYRDSQYLFPINVGSEQTVTINELINIICSIENKELKRNYITGPTGVKARSSNNDLIKDVLFWSPDQDLTFGIEKTYLWIKNQIKLRDGIL